MKIHNRSEDCFGIVLVSEINRDIVSCSCSRCLLIFLLGHLTFNIKINSLLSNQKAQVYKQDALAEWLRRWPAKPMGSPARVRISQASLLFN